ncbi:hypothetical protein [Streptosporangium sp. NPDC002524]|uniref:hypothetical protein n=1 Tax=Streptosporangium sp. NPDC002524 TaxID=3154537 RepID=UPI0033320A73
MCDWLLKPPTHIKVTGDLETVLTWLEEQWRQLESSLAYPGQEQRLGGGEGRLKDAQDALRHCGSMAWGHWLRAERFGLTAVVGCPDVHAPHYRCPTGR